MMLSLSVVELSVVELLVVLEDVVGDILGSSGAPVGQWSTVFLKFNWKNLGADYSNFTIIC